MSNNREMYCEHCRRTTTFFMESDLLWYCDECGNVYGSIPLEEPDEELENDDDIGEVVRCPHCKNLVDIDELVDGYLCPVCFDDLSSLVDEEDEEE